MYIDEIKDFLKIDNYDHDNVLEVYETIAIEYIKTMIWTDVYDENSGDDKIILSIKLLVKDQFEFHEWRIKKESVDWDSTEWDFNKWNKDMVNTLLSNFFTYVQS